MGVFLWAAGCGKSPVSSQNSDGNTPSAVPGIVLTFTYGSEKEEWVKAATAAFNQSGAKMADGKSIQVNAVPLGSGECIDSLLNETIKADITSPASAAFIKIGNAGSRTKTGRDLVGRTENLVLSPVVIAMWKPMAEALGWPEKPVGWSDILMLARTPNAWSSKGFPQWGEFKFGHTHPEYSNSGLISLFAEVYAATGKVSGLTLGDLQTPQTAAYLSGIEQSVVHYGSSTGFFGKKMFAGGPEYLSAAVLYENMVIESYSGKYQTPFPVVAIYPKEGTFWSDHPAGIVERDWVTPEKRDAARKYIDFLLAPAQQQQALRFGFRPALAEVPLAAPIDAAHGVNPKEPQTTLEVPGNEIIDATLRLWRENKKRARITLVFDISGSMRQENRIENARLGGLELLKQIGDSDFFALDPFNNRLLADETPALLKDKRAAYERQISSLFAGGGTALYDSIDAAYQTQMSSRRDSGGSITAIVVLTDGADTDSKLTIDQLIQRIQSDDETRNIRVFTIGYGAEAQQDVLERIADATQAKFYKGTPQNIREVFKEIATFF
ncbi:MAG TPA: VWA domain-containing protein [Chthoniobacterales bacterium]